MQLSDIITPEAVLPAVRATSKKQAFREVAQRAFELYGQEAREVLEGLLERERLGSTAMGAGVAIPHARLEGLDRITGVFARLDKPVDFEAADSQDVDLMFVLLAPHDAGADHLRALARVSRLMRNPGVCTKLRSSDNPDALHALLTEATDSRAA